MKKLITTAILLLTIVACKKENNPITKLKEAVESTKEVKQSFEGLQEVLKGTEDVKDNIERLSKLKTTSSSQIKSWMPETIGDFKRTAFKIEKQMGISMVNLTFENEENKEIDITIIDGADMGSAAVSMYLMAENANIESEDETGYTRTEIFDNHKVMVTYEKLAQNESSELKTVIAKRFLVEAKSKNFKPQELWAYIKQLNIENLKN